MQGARSKTPGRVKLPWKSTNRYIFILTLVPCSHLMPWELPPFRCLGINKFSLSQHAHSFIQQASIECLMLSTHGKSLGIHSWNKKPQSLPSYSSNSIEEARHLTSICITGEGSPESSSLLLKSSTKPTPRMPINPVITLIWIQVARISKCTGTTWNLVKVDTDSVNLGWGRHSAFLSETQVIRKPHKDEQGSAVPRIHPPPAQSKLQEGKAIA